MDTRTTMEVEGYIERWRDHDGFSDFNLFLDKGYIELACKFLVVVGAINSEKCFEWAKPVELRIETLVQRYSYNAWMQDLDNCLKGIDVWYCEELKRFHYVDPNFHTVDESEMTKQGFIRILGVGSKLKQVA